ncbi:MAG: 4'-phosphopantetheinyl transferase superfamily protein [Prevotella sp.]|nr:4'-phosphopantetheinyl transferase superfamily protein [Prevotella sp.]
MYERIEYIFAEYGYKASGAYVLDRIGEVPGEDVAALQASLPAWRREKTLAIKRTESRRESVLAFALLMYALRAEHGIIELPEFDYLPHGKPFLRNHPGIHFNISHCKEAVACVTGTSPVGIDIERRGRYSDLLARKVMNEKELRSLAAAADRDLAFTRLWTCKEAILKLQGTGIAGDMQNVIPDNPGITLFTFEKRGYVCAIAQEQKSNDARSKRA